MKYIFNIINCIFVVMAAYFCVDIGYKTLLPETKIQAKTKISEKALRVPRGGENRPVADATQNKLISQRNLFNVEIEKQDTASAPVDNVPEKLEPTHLKLLLWGTVTGGDDKYAVIEDKKSRQQSLYLVGDTIQGAKVKKILRHRVVLSFQGKDQVLEMEIEDKNVSAPGRPIANGASPSPIRAPLTTNLDLSQLPEAAGEFMRQIKFRPHYTEGEPDGLMVYGIRPNSVFRKIGLRNGDIVKQINGTPILSQEDAASMFNEIVNSDQSKVSLLRRGKIQELVYQMNDGDDGGGGDDDGGDDDGGDDDSEPAVLEEKK